MTTVKVIWLDGGQCTYRCHGVKITADVLLLGQEEPTEDSPHVGIPLVNVRTFTVDRFTS